MYSLNLFAEQCMDVIGRSYMFVTFGSWRVTAKWKHADKAKDAVQLQPIWEKQVHENMPQLDLILLIEFAFQQVSWFLVFCFHKPWYM